MAIRLIRQRVESYSLNVIYLSIMLTSVVLWWLILTVQLIRLIIIKETSLWSFLWMISLIKLNWKILQCAQCYARSWDLGLNIITSVAEPQYLFILFSDYGWVITSCFMPLPHAPAAMVDYTPKMLVLINPLLLNVFLKGIMQKKI